MFEQPRKAKLINHIGQYFGKADFRLLVANMGINYDFNIERESLDLSIEALVDYTERRGRTDELLQRITEARPNVDPITLPPPTPFERISNNRRRLLFLAIPLLVSCGIIFNFNGVINVYNSFAQGLNPSPVSTPLPTNTALPAAFTQIETSEMTRTLPSRVGATPLPALTPHPTLMPLPTQTAVSDAVQAVETTVPVDIEVLDTATLTPTLLSTSTTSPPSVTPIPSTTQTAMPTSSPTPTRTSTPTLTPVPQATQTATPTSTATAMPTPTRIAGSGCFVYTLDSLEEDSSIHLFDMATDSMQQLPVPLSSGSHRHAVWSPDGTKIAFTTTADANTPVAECENDCNWEIYVMNRDGSNLQRITNNTFADRYPTWSPDGRSLAFISVRNDNMDIYRTEIANPQAEQQLTKHSANDAQPDWSPDGSKIVFRSTRDNLCEGCSELYWMNADGSYLERLTDFQPGLHTQPSWSHDGKKVVFSSQPSSDGLRSLYTIDFETRNVTTLLSLSQNVSRPDWSPDGQWIIHIRVNSGIADIWMIASDGSGNPISLIKSANLNTGQPYWQPFGASTCLN